MADVEVHATDAVDALVFDGEEFKTREEEFEKRIAGMDGRDQLVAYGDFSLSWKPGEDDVGELTEFQRLLLAACRGHQDPRLYLDGM